MHATFWNGWQLWEKMCLILGCAIVLVICGGCVKLGHNNYRIRKHAQLAAEQAHFRLQMQHTVSVKRGRRNDIPFGVRALESGIEVDGVWISGSNTPAGSTPVNSAPGSPTLAAVTEGSKIISHDKAPSDRASLPSQISHIDIPQPVYGQDASRLSIPVSGNAKQTYQPRRSSGLRFSDSSKLFSNNLDDRAAALATLEGHSVEFGPADEVHEAHRRSKSWATTSWNESYNPTSESSQAASNRALLHPVHHPSERLAGFPSHKKSPSQDPNEQFVKQETSGPSAVYLPNSSHSPMSYEDFPDEGNYQSANLYENDSSSSDASDPFISPRKPTETPQGQDTQVQPVGSSQSAVAQREWNMESKDSSFHDVPLERTAVRYPHETIEQPRRSQVIRKINSGFEILRPGTLAQPRQSSDIVLGSIHRVAEPSQKSERKKLQRRRGDFNLGKV